MGMRATLMKVLAVAAVVCFSASCTTVYDSQGRPQQVVTPEGAAIGAVAAGLLGYALADDNHSHRHHRYRGHHYRGYGYGGRCY